MARPENKMAQNALRNPFKTGLDRRPCALSMECNLSSSLELKRLKIKLFATN